MAQELVAEAIGWLSMQPGAGHRHGACAGQAVGRPEGAECMLLPGADLWQAVPAAGVAQCPDAVAAAVDMFLPAAGDWHAPPATGVA